MPVYSFGEAPAEVRKLLVRSRNGKRDPEEVRRELAKLGINRILQVLYLRDGLGLSLEQAKRVVMSGDKLEDSWVDDMDRAVSEAVSDEA